MNFNKIYLIGNYVSMYPFSKFAPPYPTWNHWFKKDTANIHTTIYSFRFSCRYTVYSNILYWDTICAPEPFISDWKHFTELHQHSTYNIFFPTFSNIFLKWRLFTIKNRTRSFKGESHEILTRKFCYIYPSGILIFAYVIDTMLLINKCFFPSFSFYIFHERKQKSCIGFSVKLYWIMPQDTNFKLKLYYNLPDSYNFPGSGTNLIRIRIRLNVILQKEPTREKNYSELLYTVKHRKFVGVGVCSPSYL